MCLLVALHDVIPGYPLVVAANRDEFLERPADPMAVLRDAAPRILGGRDLLAGGTWLAVSQDGVFAALTNSPTQGRDAAKRSRGELPVALAAHSSAETAVSEFCRAFRPADFNPAWILAGDRRRLYYIDFTGGDFPHARRLDPGIHVLENRPLAPPSPKAAMVGRLVAARGPGDLVSVLAGILASHEFPEGAAPGPGRPPEIEAPCVHAGPYGTRSSILLRVGPAGPPDLWFTAGPPCTHPFQDASFYWPPSSRRDRSLEADEG